MQYYFGGVLEYGLGYFANEIGSQISNAASSTVLHAGNTGNNITKHAADVTKKYSRTFINNV